MRRIPSLERMRRGEVKPVVVPRELSPAEDALQAFVAFAETNPGVHLPVSRPLHILKRYGLTKESFMELFLRQRGVCAICGRKSRRELAIDHCHRKGTVRGLLCGKCNTALGQFNDDPELLRSAIAYLEK